jgi:glutamyl-tRNA synthetase
MSESNIRVRYAPSPTGFPHVGNIRTALFNWLFARHTGGSFIVRIEDTDVNRKVEGATEAILDSLRWLGLDWDEGPEVGGNYGPYFQSQRLEHYQKIVRQLVEEGHAYPCYCSEERLAQMRTEMAKNKESTRSYDRRCRDLSQEERAKFEAQGIIPVFRFKIPLEGQIRFNDIIKGEVVFDNSNLDDLVLLKSDGYPTYHLANVVDDHLMKITHVLRADEWLSSTPRHLLLYNALGYKPPLFAHLPMILGPDRSKLSKRHGATAVTEFRNQGYIAESMVNYLALLGWSLDDKTEIFSRKELVANFSLERVSATAAIFDHQKLAWMNGVYLRQLSSDEFARLMLPFLEKDLPAEVKRPLDHDYVNQVAPFIQERIRTLNETKDQADFFFVAQPPYETKLLLQRLHDKAIAINALSVTRDKLASEANLEAASLENMLRLLSTELGLKTGEFFSLLRVAVTTRTATPPLFQTMAILGKERCLKRIETAILKLQAS